MTDQPTVTETRTALLKEASDFYHRRQPYHRAMHDIHAGQRKDNPAYDALFDAYEGFVSAGCFAETLATVLRIVEQRHPETASDLAALVAEVRENGADCLDGANDDVWPLVESAAAEAGAR